MQVTLHFLSRESTSPQGQFSNAQNPIVHDGPRAAACGDNLATWYPGHMFARLSPF